MIPVSGGLAHGWGDYGGGFGEASIFNLQGFPVTPGKKYRMANIAISGNAWLYYRDSDGKPYNDAAEFGRDALLVFCNLPAKIFNELKAGGGPQIFYEGGAARIYTSADNLDTLESVKTAQLVPFISTFDWTSFLPLFFATNTTGSDIDSQMERLGRLGGIVYLQSLGFFDRTAADQVMTVPVFPPDLPVTYDRADLYSMKSWKSPLEIEFEPVNNILMACLQLIINPDSAVERFYLCRAALSYTLETI